MRVALARLLRRGRPQIYVLQPRPHFYSVGRRWTPGFTRWCCALNIATKLPVVCPITNGGEFARRIGFAVPIVGVKTTGVVRCDQPRVLDLDARNARKVDTLPEAIMDEVLARLAPIFE